MATAIEQRTMIESKLATIRSQIATLQAQEKVLSDLLAEMKGEPAPQVRRRSPSVKPIVIDVMSAAGPAGATSREVDEAVRAKVPTVADDTVGSVLSRLKADGALVYVGERYYEKRFAPPPLRAVV